MSWTGRAGSLVPLPPGTATAEGASGVDASAFSTEEAGAFRCESDELPGVGIGVGLCWWW